jgi:lipopolysaccharide/colanic/teichoic acid biosynthesis glycosyltransferase
MNRLFDIILALILLLISLPFWIIIMIVIMIFSPGNPFFRHTRVGRGGREFGLIKFRTMIRSQPGDMCITVKGDRRVTGIGRILRKTKLDEIPQLLNILTGVMAFIGPRPEAPKFVAAYTPEQRKILNYRPGLVDPATLKYRHEERILAEYPDPQKAYLERILPDKLRISLDYQRDRGSHSDLMVILRTLTTLFQKR